MNGWRTKKLGELCEIELGRTPARANASFWDTKRETGNVWLSIADLLKAKNNVVVDSKEYVSDKGAEICKLVPQGTLLVSFKLTLGRLAFAGCNLFTNEAIAALTIFNERDLSKEFLFHFLHFFDWTKAAENDVKLKGMTLNKAKLKEMDVHFPGSSAEQQRIVGILDEAFAGIATAKANFEANLRNARALFESHLQSVFTQRGEDWIDRTIAQSFKVRSGDFLPARAMDVSGDIDVYGGNGVAGKHNESNLMGDNILIGRVGAKCGNVRRVQGDVWVTDNAFFVSEYFHAFDLGFLARALDRQQLRSTANQAAQPVISYTTIKDVTLAFPISTDHQIRIANELDVLEAETQRLESLYQRKLAALDALKKSLLHQAFSGAL